MNGQGCSPRLARSSGLAVRCPCGPDCWKQMAEFLLLLLLAAVSIPPPLARQAARVLLCGAGTATALHRLVTSGTRHTLQHESTSEQAGSVR